MQCSYQVNAKLQFYLQRYLECCLRSTCPLIAGDVAHAVSCLLLRKQPLPIVSNDVSDMLMATVVDMLRYIPKDIEADEELDMNDFVTCELFVALIKLRTCADLCTIAYRQPQVMFGMKHIKRYVSRPRSVTIMPVGRISAVPHAASRCTNSSSIGLDVPGLISFDISDEEIGQFACHNKILTFVLSKIGMPLPSALPSNLVPIVACIDELTMVDTLFDSLASQISYGYARLNMWSIFRTDIFCVPDFGLNPGGQVHLILLVDIDRVRALEPRQEEMSAELLQEEMRCIVFATFAVFDWLNDCEARLRLRPDVAPSIEASAAHSSSTAEDPPCGHAESKGAEEACTIPPESRIAGKEGEASNFLHRRMRSQSLDAAAAPKVGGHMHSD